MRSLLFVASVVAAIVSPSAADGLDEARENLKEKIAEGARYTATDRLYGLIVGEETFWVRQVLIDEYLTRNGRRSPTEVVKHCRGIVPEMKGEAPSAGDLRGRPWYYQGRALVHLLGSYDPEKTEPEMFLALARHTSGVPRLYDSMIADHLKPHLAESSTKELWALFGEIEASHGALQQVVALTLAERPDASPTRLLTEFEQDGLLSRRICKTLSQRDDLSFELSMKLAGVIESLDEL